MPEPVVVGIDGSAAADSALEWAADEAALLRRPLRIVHAADPWHYTAPTFQPPVSVEELTRAASSMLAAAEASARDRRPEIEITSELLKRDLGPALREESERAFELVLGHRGRGGFTSLLLGSTGLRMAAHAAGPVVIVRGERPSEHGDVVVGVDLARDEAQTLRCAFEAASARQARLRVIHAWQVADTLAADGFVFNAEEIGERVERLLTETTDEWRKRHPGVDVVDQVVRGHPVRALCEASASASLVVVGEHARRWFDVPRLGSVSHGVIHHSDCPVVIARTR